MSDHASRADERPLYEQLDDAGKAWFDQVIEAFNAGGYKEAVAAFLADEAAADATLED
jgi:hypothetical protein